MNRVVLDTNVLVMSLPARSPYHRIIDKLLDGEFTLLITEDIFHEYMEVIAKKSSLAAAENIGKMLTLLENVARVNVFYKWNLIDSDFDDNKFADCAISGNANYIVTNDKHFNILKQVDFPKVNIIRAEDFLKKL